MAQVTILQLLHSLNVGGAEVLAAGLARKLQGQYRFVFACLDELGPLGEELQREGFPIEVLGRSDGLDWKCAVQLRKLFRSQRVDVVHAHQYTPFFYTLGAGLLWGRPPVLFTEHGRFHPDYPRPKRMMFNRTLLRKKDRVLAVGEAVRQALIHNEGIPESRTDVIYNGIDLDRFNSLDAEATKARMRETLQIPPGTFVAILVGRLDYLKNHLTAVRTAELVVKSNPDFRMLFVGEGSERHTIEAEIRSRNLQNTITLLGTRHDVPELLCAADVCFLCSISEGIPLTLIEGMAMSLPVVATNVGGVAEVVVAGKTGLLSAAGDDADLATNLLTLSKSSQLRERYGQQGMQRAKDLFAETEMHRKYQLLYNEMSGQKSMIETKPAGSLRNLSLNGH